MDRAVVLLSGGINSTVAAAVAREKYELALLHIAWAHRTAERELAAFEQIAAAMQIEKTLVADLHCLAIFGGSSRVSKRLPIEDANTLGRNVPATFMLGLMPSMISLAAAWAGSIKAKRILLGISEDHRTSGPAISELYPDYRRDFLQVFNLMLHYAKPPERDLIVEAPLIDLSRPEVVRLGEQLKVPFDKTWSCYGNNNQPCGRCLACVTRATGFLKAGVPDPLLLEPAHM